MSTNKRKRGISKTQKIIFVAELIILVGLGTYYAGTKVKETVVNKATEQIVESAITYQAKQMGASEEEVQKVLDQISEEDKQVALEIVTDHLDSDAISKGTQYIENRDIEGLKQYASEELSPEEVQTLLSLYEKYIE